MLLWYVSWRATTLLSVCFQTLIICTDLPGRRLWIVYHVLAVACYFYLA